MTDAASPIHQANPRLAQALALHRAGYAPLCFHHPADTPSGCSCYSPEPGKYQRLTCDKVGKHPRHRWRPREDGDPLPDARQLARLWSWHPDSNVGWRMGMQPNGQALFTLDIDPAGLGWYEEHGRNLPETVGQRTQRGGLQLVYSAPPEIVAAISNSVRRVADGVDVRADGGLITCAPSRGPKGAYTWITGHSPLDHAPAAAPDWLLAILPRKRAEEPPVGPVRPQGAPSRAGLAGLQRWAARGLAQGDRDNNCYWLACELAREGASPADGQAIIETFAAACRPPLERTVALEKWERAQREVPYGPRPRRPRAPAPPPPPPPPVPVELPSDVNDPAALLAVIQSMAADLAAMRAALEREQAARQEAARTAEYMRAMLRVPNVLPGILKIAPFVVWQHEQRKSAGEADAAGWTRCNMRALAESCAPPGADEAEIARRAEQCGTYVADMAALGWLERRIEATTDEASGKPRKLVYIRPTAALLADPAALPYPERKVARPTKAVCPRCDSSQTRRVVLCECLECGYLFPAPADPDQPPDGDDPADGEAAAPYSDFSGIVGGTSMLPNDHSDNSRIGKAIPAGPPLRRAAAIGPICAGGVDCGCGGLHLWDLPPRAGP